MGWFSHHDAVEAIMRLRSLTVERDADDDASRLERERAGTADA